MENTLKILTEMQSIVLKCQSTQDAFRKIKNEAKGKKCPSLILYGNDFIDTSLEENLISLIKNEPEAFYGRTCSFQFSDSIKRPITALSILFASYNDGYNSFPSKDFSSFKSTCNSSENKFSNTDHHKSNNSLSFDSPASVSKKTVIKKATKTSICASKYIINPELRARKVTSSFKNADIGVCKEFWRLTDVSLPAKMLKIGSKIVTPKLEINMVKSIPLKERLVLPKSEFKQSQQNSELITISPPIVTNPNDSINIRILSYKKLMGMVIIFFL